MYIPKHFQHTDIADIQHFIQAYAFATLITQVDGIPYATHLPIYMESTQPLRLSGHLAKANPQWQHFSPQQRVLIIFQGPHAYISPTWYKTAGVPTWNYAAVHVYGYVTLIQDKERLQQLVCTLSRHYEGGGDNAWQAQFSPQLLDAIVGFEMVVDDIQAKYKLSQNRSQTDRYHIQQALRASHSEQAQLVAELMQTIQPQE